MSSEKVAEFTEANFEQEVLASSQPVLVDFWAEWCAPCLMVGPIVEQLAAEYEGRAKVGKLDVSAHQGVAVKLGITRIPALFVFKDGQPVKRIIGVRSKMELKAAMDEALS